MVGATNNNGSRAEVGETRSERVRKRPKLQGDVIRRNRSMVEHLGGRIALDDDTPHCHPTARHVAAQSQSRHWKDRIVVT